MNKTSFELASEQNQAGKEVVRDDFLRATAKRSDAKSLYGHHYMMLASGIVGRRVGIAYRLDKKTPVYTDGRYIFLPESDHNNNHRLAVMVQAAILANGALRRDIARKLVGRPRAARRFLYLEVHRAVTTLREQLPRQLVEHKAFKASGPLSNSIEESLTMAFSRLRLPEPPEFFGSIRPIQIIKTTGMESEFTTPTQDYLEGNFSELQMEELADDEDAEEVKLLRLFNNPAFSGGIIADMLRKILGMGTSPGEEGDEEQGGAGTVRPVAREESWVKRGMNALLSLIPVEIPSGTLAPEAGAKTYPEWDEFNKRYRPNWTSVQEYDSWYSDEKCDLGAIIEPPDRALRRSLSNIGLSHERHRYQPQGDDFNLDDLVRLIVDARTGHAPDERIYCAALKTRRDLGVLVLLDISGSVAEIGSEGGCVFDLQAKAAYQIVKVLEELGDRVAFYSFYSWGRNLVRLLRVKSFEDRMDGVALDRLAHLSPVGYTRLGAAVRHAATILEYSSGTPHRLLMIITDGFTYDEGYEGVYGEADAKRAIHEVRKRGMGVACLNIGSTTEERKLKNIFGSSCHMSVSKPDHMSRRLGDLFCNAIGEVMWRKKRFEHFLH